VRFVQEAEAAAATAAATAAVEGAAAEALRHREALLAASLEEAQAELFAAQRARAAAQDQLLELQAASEGAAAGAAEASDLSVEELERAQQRCVARAYFGLLPKQRPEATQRWQAGWSQRLCAERRGRRRRST
jgi:hypothetical protein